ncbi:MAG TPA: hypothetical protein VGW75_11040 [Solirubrobacteraceae bacterium]|nr:hypothetical protein [Solirubrobacteraceae bacterium]
MTEPAAAPHSAALRLLAARGCVRTGRAQIVARGLVRRARGGSAWALWPDAAHPLQGTDVTAPEAALYMRTRFADASAPRRPLLGRVRAHAEPLSWELARAGALLEPAADGLAARAIREVLGDDLPDPRIVLFSPSGSQLAKAVCFAFAPGREEPDAVVLAMADPRWSDRLRHETDLVEELRRRLARAPGAARALPLPPLGRLSPPGDFAVVARPDPLAGSTGDLVSPDRERAWRWLRELHAATTVRSAPLGPGGVEAALGDVREAWSLLGDGAADRALALARPALEAVAEAPLPVGAVHGDFWRGNVSHDDASLRVFDWEWGRLEGWPAFDLWTYELSDAQLRTRLRPDAAVPSLREGLGRVRAELDARGLPAALAAAALAPAAAEMILRIRRATGRPGPGEPSLLALLEPIERVLAAERAG